MDQLYQKRMKLEAGVRHFENNNEQYGKIRNTVEEKVQSILSDRRMVLKLALVSLIESMRKDPDKYSHLFIIITRLQHHEHKQQIIILFHMDNNSTTHHRPIQICY
jgi:hypothetical protein